MSGPGVVLGSGASAEPDRRLPPQPSPPPMTQFQADLLYQPVMLPPGLLAARPSAASVPPNTTYFATDQAGGTVYRSNGASWAALGAGANAIAGVELAYQEITTVFPTTSTAAVDITGLTGISFTSPANGKVVLIAHGPVYNDTATRGVTLSIADSGSNLEYARARTSGPGLGAGDITTLHAEERILLTPSTVYTIKARLNAEGGGQAIIFGNAAAPRIPVSVRVMSA